jgi:multiphosphoryl transfer protein
MILGLCTARGGPTSHTAILARGFGLPAVVGAGEAVLDVANGTLGILDGESGKLYLKPSEVDVQAARDLQQQLKRQLGSRDHHRRVSGEGGRQRQSRR